MARRTKEEAEETRLNLLDAAEHVFRAHGVANSTLDQIAERAGTTRGAIQWHFKDKAGLFQAMLESVAHPIHQRIVAKVDEAASEPLVIVVAHFLEPLRTIVQDERARSVISIAAHMVEYADELAGFRSWNLASQQSMVSNYQAGLRAAARRHGVRLSVTSEVAARALHAMLCGLIESWVMHPAEFDLMKTGRGALCAHLIGLGFQPATLRACGLGSALRPIRSAP